MSTPRLRVGSVPYLVGRPLDLGLDLEPEVEFMRAVPSRLVAGLRDGSLDVALVSSIELFRRPGYRYLPNLCVAGRGSVSSVQLFLHRPLESVRRVALDPASRTTAALVEVLADDVGLDATFEEPQPGVDPRAAGMDAWLRIGDTALRERFELPELPRIDPCAAWVEATGLPFVFAVWIVRSGAEIAGRESLFVDARRRGREGAARAAEEHASKTGLPLSAVTSYLQDECTYELGRSVADSLAEFRRRAAQLDLVDPSLEAVPLGATTT